MGLVVARLCPAYWDTGTLAHSLPHIQAGTFTCTHTRCCLNLPPSLSAVVDIVASATCKWRSYFASFLHASVHLHGYRKRHTGNHTPTALWNPVNAFNLSRTDMPQPTRGLGQQASQAPYHICTTHSQLRVQRIHRQASASASAHTYNKEKIKQQQQTPSATQRWSCQPTWAIITSTVKTTRTERL